MKLPSPSPRIPDEGISGTQIQEIMLTAGQILPVAEGFKVTAAPEIVGPGKDQPEAVEGTPTFTYADINPRLTAKPARGSIPGATAHESPSTTTPPSRR